MRKTESRGAKGRMALCLSLMLSLSLVMGGFSHPVRATAEDLDSHIPEAEEVVADSPHEDAEGDSSNQDQAVRVSGRQADQDQPALDIEAEKADAVIDAHLGVGDNQFSRLFNWLSTSSRTGYVQIAKAPQGWKAKDGFPASGSRSVEATSVPARRAGYSSLKAAVSGLEPSTTYVYRVGNNDGWSKAYSFTTTSSATAGFSFLVVGDPQLGASGNLGNDGNGWVRMLAAAQSSLPADLLLSMGDQVNNYDGAATDSEYDAYFAPDYLRSVAVATQVGNHDEGSHTADNSRYSDYNNLPNVSDKGATPGAGSQGGDYWFTYNGVLFMSLNSNDTNTADHKAFLEEALRANPTASWRIVTFHHAIFSTADHNTDEDIVARRSELTPVFSELGIDAVFMGHDHHYTRTYLLDANGTPEIPEGADVSKGEEPPSSYVAKDDQVLYLTANSASGSKYYKLNKAFASAKPVWCAKDWQDNMPSVTRVTVEGDKMTFASYYQAGDGSLSEFDSFTLSKSGQPNHEETSEATKQTELSTQGPGSQSGTGQTTSEQNEQDANGQALAKTPRTGSSKVPNTGDGTIGTPLVTGALALAAAAAACAAIARKRCR